MAANLFMGSYACLGQTVEQKEEKIFTLGHVFAVLAQLEVEQERLNKGSQIKDALMYLRLERSVLGDKLVYFRT